MNMNIRKLVMDLEDVKDDAACKCNVEDVVEKLSYIITELKLTKEYKQEQQQLPIELTEEYTNRIKRDEDLVRSFSAKPTACKYINKFLAYIEEEFNMKITQANYMLLAYKRGKHAKRKKH